MNQLPAGYTDEQKKRADECSKEIAEVLKKHNCFIHTSLTIIEGGKMQFNNTVLAKSSIIKPN